MIHIPSMAYLPELLNNTIIVKKEHTFVSIGLCKLVCWWSQNLLINVADIEFSINFPFLVLTGNTKGGSVTVPLTSCLTGLESAV
jgi:hypothetical protein